MPENSQDNQPKMDRGEFIRLAVTAGAIGIGGALCLTASDNEPNRKRYYVNDIYSPPDPSLKTAVAEELKLVDAYPHVWHYGSASGVPKIQAADCVLWRTISFVEEKGWTSTVFAHDKYALDFNPHTNQVWLARIDNGGSWVGGGLIPPEFEKIALDDIIDSDEALRMMHADPHIRESIARLDPRKELSSCTLQAVHSYHDDSRHADYYQNLLPAVVRRNQEPYQTIFYHLYIQQWEARGKDYKRIEAVVDARKGKLVATQYLPSYGSTAPREELLRNDSIKGDALKKETIFHL